VALSTTGASAPIRWLFADQLGAAFDDGGEAFIIVSRRAFARRRMHRAKALIYLSAMMHRAASDPERISLIVADTYSEGVTQIRAAHPDRGVEAIAPSTRPARELVASLGVRMLEERGFITSAEEFSAWVTGRKRLVLEDFYRATRQRTGILMNPDGTPTGGAWNFDADNRLPPPRTADLGLHTNYPGEDAIDAQAREMLTAWEAEGWLQLRGSDGPRLFAVTEAEARAALADFIAHRLALFGPYEDAAMAADWVMAHSLLSVPMNLGLLHPQDAIDAVVAAYEASNGDIPLAGVEGFVRQVMGWREYVWHLYWWFGADYTESNALDAHTALPDWFDDLDAEQVQAACLRHSLDEVAQHGWAHHIIRLEILGNYALQQGFEPAAVNEWFVDAFVDGTGWVMPANVIGMSLYADGGQMATKPYAAGGAYINRMTNFCRGCCYKPTIRVGPQACPFTAGYWAFLHRNADALRSNHRLRNPYSTMGRLKDLEELLEQESRREGPL
jgi:deoxyribodipyrimidine photolyase-related protein